ncbi:DNA-directed RNA polymerase subunit delta [Caldalkalibacillus mannanilyticus]|uniref:DNA-directed RNA polymerase subunit delta n=1 Tax=Caldalkalibacillus mannanilyticus TaxID=1418 RepID=UPI00046815BB|nr:DNA-directed RNA polymerase subunit delta [Caldalkalibacillus mannanilyticus]
MSIRDLDREVIMEMSMVDIVYALLKESNKEPKPYHVLLDEVAALKGFTQEQKVDAMPRLYTEINIDGRFNGLGDNVWGLRSWYPVEQVEEIVITELKKKPKKKKKDEDDDYLDDDYLEDELIDEDDLLLDDEDDLDDLDDLDENLDEEIEDIDDLDEDLDDSIDEDLELEDDDLVDDDESEEDSDFEDENEDL